MGYKEVLHTIKETRNTVHGIDRRKAKQLVTFCVGSAFQNTLLKDKSDAKTTKKT